jgi:hypothetical protein
MPPTTYPKNADIQRVPRAPKRMTRWRGPAATYRGEAFDDLVGGADDDRLDLLRLRQRHAVVARA